MGGQRSEVSRLCILNFFGLMFTFLFTVYVVECWIGLVCDAISNVRLKMGFAVAFHHMGRFERNRGLKYVGGEIHVVSGIDPDF